MYGDTDMATQRVRCQKGGRKPKCCNPNCKSLGKRKEAYALGLCEACHKALRRMIKSGKTTMEKAIRDGNCLPYYTPGANRFPAIAMHGSGDHSKRSA